MKPQGNNVFNLLPPPALMALALTGILLGGVAQAQAAQMAVQLDDFQPNCDIRQLSLSPEQRNQLRSIRTEHKKALDQANRKNDRINRNRQRNLMRILAADDFNESFARGYVGERYAPSMDFAVDELKIQHRFFQLLTPDQRRLWLNACLK
jgi:protein CpxP